MVCYLSIHARKVLHLDFNYPFKSSMTTVILLFRYNYPGFTSVVHLSRLVVKVLRLGVLNVIITLGIGHRLIHVRLILSLLHVKREVLVVTIHIRSVGVREGLVQRN